jgi:hypothetical protein
VKTGLFGYSHEISDASALTPALSPRRGRIVRRSFENLYDWIGRTPICKTRNNRKLFSLLGERIKVRAGDNTNSTENVEEAYLSFCPGYTRLLS